MEILLSEVDAMKLAWKAYIKYRNTWSVLFSDSSQYREAAEETILCHGFFTIDSLSIKLIPCSKNGGFIVTKK